VKDAPAAWAAISGDEGCDAGGVHEADVQHVDHATRRVQLADGVDRQLP
jgi:hypothetical protein